VVDTHVTKMLASAYKDRLRVTMICRTILSVHITYPLCGWVRSRASKCGTKLVGGSSIGAAGEDADLTFSETQRRIHSLGAIFCGRMRLRPRKSGWYRGY
jgi:hypothetical protein